MGSYLTLIGSFIIGALFLLSINRFQSSFTQNSYEKGIEVINIQKSSSIVKLIEHDFNRIGYGVATSLYHSNVRAIKAAGSDSIYFYSDINEDKNVDSLKYYLSYMISEDGTEDPQERILYRVVNNQADDAYAISGVTQFQIKYFDPTGNEITALADSIQVAKIRTFEITLEIESTIAYEDKYPTFFWQTKITPPNIARY